jgi:hypothetical protein
MEISRGLGAAQQQGIFKQVALQSWNAWCGAVMHPKQTERANVLNASKEDKMYGVLLHLPSSLQRSLQRPLSQDPARNAQRLHEPYLHGSAAQDRQHYTFQRSQNVSHGAGTAPHELSHGP